MYLFLGQDTVVRADEIVGIFDLENTTTSRITKLFLREAQENGQIIEVSSELPKSFIVCQGAGKTRVYLSQISPATLRKRSDYLKDLGGP